MPALVLVAIYVRTSLLKKRIGYTELEREREKRKKKGRFLAREGKLGLGLQRSREEGRKIRRIQSPTLYSSLSLSLNLLDLNFIVRLKSSQREIYRKLLMGFQSFPISEMDSTDDMHEAMFAKRGCCFLIPCLRSSQPSGHGGSVWWQRIRTVDKLEPDDRWWVSRWRKTREWSELVAGPKWKNFIRRFGRNHCCGGGDGGVNRPEQVSFRYDSWSYSLNFDDGKQTGHFEDEFPYRDYSMKFTSPSLPVSTKCSIDFDNDKHAPSLFK